MRRMVKMVVAFVSLFMLVRTASAQGLFEGAPEGPSDCASHVAKFLYRELSFTADVLVTRDYKQGQKPDVFQAKIAVLDGKVRSELQPDGKAGQQVPDVVGDWGLAKSELIYRPDRGVAIILIPGTKSYYELPDLKLADPGALPLTIRRKELNDEQMDGHPCKKVEMHLADKSGDICKSVAWLARDLADIPVKMQVLGADVTVTVSLREIKKVKPDRSLFEPPKEYKRYASHDELVVDQMKQPGQQPFGK